MRELTHLHRAMPEVAPATDAERDRARARLRDLIAVEETAGPPLRDGERFVVARPSPLDRPTDLDADPTGPAVPGGKSAVGSRVRTLLAAAAVLLAAMWVAESIVAPASRTPVVGEVEELIPPVPTPDEFGTHAIRSRPLTLWDGQGVPATVVSPVAVGPWPQVILLPHEFARNEWSTFPQLHVEAMQPVAELIASSGATVITLGAVERRQSIEAFDRIGENVRCATAHARSGTLGDPGRVVLFGQGQSSYEALVAISAERPARSGCRATGGALPDIVIAAVGVYDLDAPWFVGEWLGDEASLESRRLPALVSRDTGVPVVFVEPPLDEAQDLIGDTLRTGALLDAAGFRTSLVEIEGLGRTAWSPTHGPTRELLALVARTAYAPDVDRGGPLPPPLVDEPAQRDGYPFEWQPESG